MPAGRVRFEHQDIEAFRGAIDCRREPRRSRADDDEVSHLCGIDRLVQGEAVGDLLIGGVAEHGLAAADQVGHLGDGNMEAIEEVLDALVVVEIDEGVREPVSREKFLDAQRAGVVVRADQDDVAESARDQFHAAQDEGLEQDLAHLAVGLDEPHQLFMIEVDRLAGRIRADLHERGAPRKHVDLSREHAGPADGDESFSRRGPSGDLDFAFGDEKQVGNALARFEQHLPLREAADTPGARVGNIRAARSAGTSRSVGVCLVIFCALNSYSSIDFARNARMANFIQPGGLARLGSW